MKINLQRLLAKHGMLKMKPFWDAIDAEVAVYTLGNSFDFKITITQHGDLLIYSHAKGANRILAEKQYFSQEKLEEDLEMFLSAFKVG